MCDFTRGFTKQIIAYAIMASALLALADAAADQEIRSISLPTFAVPCEVSGKPTLIGRPRRRESGVAAGEGDLLLLLRGLQ